MVTKELTTTNNNFSLEDKSLLLQTVAKGATDAEFKMFAEFCRSTGLNPFKKEIWFIKTNGGVQMMTGINGFLAIANNHPQYDGMEVSINEQNGKLISATAKVYRKDRRIPSTATVYMEEYGKNSPTWKQMPRVMLQKVAKSVALREAFPQELNGIYTQEEMPTEYSQPQYNKQEEVKKHIYNLSLIEDEAKKEKLMEFLEDKGIEVSIINGNEYIESEKELSKLKNYEVKEKEQLNDK